MKALLQAMKASSEPGWTMIDMAMGDPSIAVMQRANAAHSYRDSDIGRVTCFTFPGAFPGPGTRPRGREPNARAGLIQSSHWRRNR